VAMPWKKLELPDADRRHELDEEYSGTSLKRDLFRKAWLPKY